jgi:proline iminopeptidase
MATSIMYRVRMSDGAEIQVKVIGDNSDNPLLIALHEAPGVSDHTEAETSFGHLHDMSRVLVYDARGSGASDLKPPFTHQRWVADIEETSVSVGTVPGLPLWNTP